jgi:hypothetical protein
MLIQKIITPEELDMKKIIILTLLSLTAGLSYAQDSTLYVQQAKSAIFAPAGEHCYHLTLFKPKHNILFFTEAKPRRFGFRSPEQMFSAWPATKANIKGGFVSNTVAGHEKRYEFSISEPAYNKVSDRINYKVCSLAKQAFTPISNQVLNNVAVFIDPFQN